MPREPGLRPCGRVFALGRRSYRCDRPLGHEGGCRSQTPTPGDYREPISAKEHGALQRLGDIAAKACPPGWGFAVLMFPFGEPGGALTYLSNAAREDMLKVMQEFLQKQAS